MISLALIYFVRLAENWHHYPHFICKETKVQRGEVMCARTTKWSIVKLRPESGSSDSKTNVFFNGPHPLNENEELLKMKMLILTTLVRYSNQSF